MEQAEREMTPSEKSHARALKVERDLKDARQNPAPSPEQIRNILAALQPKKSEKEVAIEALNGILSSALQEVAQTHETLRQGKGDQAALTDRLDELSIELTNIRGYILDAIKGEK